MRITLIVDCGDCKVRDTACADCVVTVLLGSPGRQTEGGVRAGSWPSKIDIDQEELGAMDVLADVGLVPRLRLVVDEDASLDSASLSVRDKATEQQAV